MSRPKVPDILTSKTLIFKCSEYRTCFKEAMKAKYRGQRDNDVDDLFDNYPAWFHVRIMDRCDQIFDCKSKVGFTPFLPDAKSLTKAKLAGLEPTFLVDNHGDFIFTDGKHEYKVDEYTKNFIFNNGNGISYEEYENKWSINLSDETNDDAAFIDAVRRAVQQVEEYINAAYANDPLKRVLNVSVEDHKNHQEFDEASETDILGAYFEKTKKIVLYRNVIKSCIEKMDLAHLTCEVISMVLVHEIEHARQDLTLYESFHSLLSLDAADKRKTDNATECFAEGAAHCYLKHIDCSELIDKWKEMRTKHPNRYTVFNGVYYWETDENTWRNLLAEYGEKYDPKAIFVY